MNLATLRLRLLNVLVTALEEEVSVVAEVDIFR